MQPSVGRIVHYHSAGDQPDPTCRAAIVTSVHEDGLVSLTVFMPTGTHVVLRADHVDNEKYGASTWHWPERV